MELAEEHRMVADLVARFVDRDLMPLEPRCWRGRRAARNTG